MVGIICRSYIYDLSYIYNLLTIIKDSISKFLFHYNFVTKFCSYCQWPPTLCFQSGCCWHFWFYVTRKSTGAYKSVSRTLLSIYDAKIVNGEKSLAIRPQKLHHRHCVKSVRIRSFSGLYFHVIRTRETPKYGLEKLQIRTLFTQWDVWQNPEYTSVLNSNWKSFVLVSERRNKFLIKREILSSLRDFRLSEV